MTHCCAVKKNAVCALHHDPHEVYDAKCYVGFMMPCPHTLFHNVFSMAETLLLPLLPLLNYTVKAEHFGGVLFSVTSVPTIFTENKTHQKCRYNRYCIRVVLEHLPGKRVLPKISLYRTAGFGEYQKYYTTENFCFYSRLFQTLTAVHES